MEGKEVRFGPAASAYWGITTTVTSNGSVNAMHDSFTPLTGMFAMLGMMVNCFYGGVGVGFFNFYVYHDHRCIHFRIDGGSNAGISGKENRSKGNEDRDHRCPAAYFADPGFYCIVFPFVCTAIRKPMPDG